LKRIHLAGQYFQTSYFFIISQSFKAEGSPSHGSVHLSPAVVHHVVDSNLRLHHPEMRGINKNQFLGIPDSPRYSALLKPNPDQEAMKMGTKCFTCIV
jgi:hypothetical protein